jgi:hypothetical protein
MGRHRELFCFEQDEHDFPILIEWVRQFKEEDADELTGQ